MSQLNKKESYISKWRTPPPKNFHCVCLYTTPMDSKNPNIVILLLNDIFLRSIFIFHF